MEFITNPMMGLLFWGEMIWFFTPSSSSISVQLAAVVPTCRFISSPSKSALYALVQHRGSRKDSPLRSSTLCPIMDGLCREGCLLNTTGSPSCR